MPEQKILNNDNNETTAALGQHAKAALNFHESGNEATSNQQHATCKRQASTYNNLQQQQCKVLQMKLKSKTKSKHAYGCPMPGQELNWTVPQTKHCMCCMCNEIKSWELATAAATAKWSRTLNTTLPRPSGMQMRYNPLIPGCCSPPKYKKNKIVRGRFGGDYYSSRRLLKWAQKASTTGSIDCICVCLAIIAAGFFVFLFFKWQQEQQREQLKSSLNSFFIFCFNCRQIQGFRSMSMSPHCRLAAAPWFVCFGLSSVLSFQFAVCSSQCLRLVHWAALFSLQHEFICFEIVTLQHPQ